MSYTREKEELRRKLIDEHKAYQEKLDQIVYNLATQLTMDDWQVRKILNKASEVKALLNQWEAIYVG